MKLFKKQPTKEQKRETNRRWNIIKEQIYPLLLENCKSVNEMKHRLESVMHAMQNEMTTRVESVKHQMEDEHLSVWNLKPLEGKGMKLEQTIIDILKDEPVKVCDQILTHLPRILDSFIYEEMGQREPKSLKVKFPE